MTSAFNTARIFCTTVVLLSSISCHEYNPDGWKEASEWILGSMDPAVEPCDDFYKFVCGKWEQTVANVSSSSIQTEGQKLFLNMLQKILAAIDQIDLSNPKTEIFKKSLKTFYTQCRTQPKVETAEDVFVLIEELYVNLLKYLGATVERENTFPEGETNAVSNMWRYVGVLQRVVGTPFPIEADVLPTEVGCKNAPTLHLFPSVSTSLELGEGFVDKLLSFVIKHSNVTATAEDIVDTKKAMIDFATNMSHFMAPYKEGDVHKEFTDDSFYQIKYSQLAKEFPDIEWKSYFSGLLSDDIRLQWQAKDPTIVLEYRDYFSGVSSIIKQHDPLTVINLATVVTLLKYADFLLSGELKYYDRRQLNKKITEDPCTELIMQYFSTACLRILIDEYKIDVRKWRNDLILMKDMTFSAFRFLIYSTDWLDAEERMVYMKSIDKIQFYGGIPAWITDDNAVNANTPFYNISSSLIINDMAAQVELFRQKMKPLATGLTADVPPSFIQNAYNDLNDNIRYLVGYQVPPFYSYIYPLAVKFGITGGTLGHELMHSFGTVLYRNPLTSEPWPEDVQMEHFPLKKMALSRLRRNCECFIPHFDEYCKTEPEDNYEGEKCLIGTRTLEENVADAEGLKLAYTTYKFAMQTMGTEPPMDDLVHLSYDQLLFISMAKEHCAPIGESKFPKDDPHSSGLSRIEQMFANFPPFSQAFGCKPGQRYYRNTSCSVYGTIWNSDE